MHCAGLHDIQIPTCSYYIDGIEMSEIHPQWNTLLKWLQQRGMNTNSILVEARRTEGEC